MPRKKAVIPAETPPGEAPAKVADITGMSGEDVQALVAQIADLKAKLEIEKSARSAAEEEALEAAKNQYTNQMQQSNVMEVPTGKTKQVLVFDRFEIASYRDDGRPILKEIRKAVEVPTFFYKIDLPPVGGEGLKINGVPLYHNMVCEFDLGELRSAKEMVHRCWKHEHDIHGEDENAYGRMSVRNKAAQFGVKAPV